MDRIGGDEGNKSIWPLSHSFIKNVLETAAVDFSEEFFPVYFCLREQKYVNLL